jgi:hypothetical protein
MSRLFLIALLLLSGCATAYRYVAVPPNLLPPRVELPKISAVELGCLTDETYSALVDRDRALRFELAQYRALLGVSHD